MRLAHAILIAGVVTACGGEGGGEDGETADALSIEQIADRDFDEFEGLIDISVISDDGQARVD